MKIPEEAIEAAAVALKDEFNIPSMLYARQESRTALEAAAPFLEARASGGAA